MLLTTAREVVAAADADLERARGELRALAGRDAASLSPALVRSAAVESAAENLADGLVAPLAWFLALAPVSPAAAAAGAAWLKAVNTLDSMLGYREKPHGWAAARLDDLAMYVPARLTAGLLALAARDPDAPLRARRWAGEPPSPNSGWPMGTLAAAAYVRLEKPDVYVLNAVSPLPDADAAGRAISLVGRAGGLGWLLGFVLALVVGAPAAGPVPALGLPGVAP